MQQFSFAPEVQKHYFENKIILQPGQRPPSQPGLLPWAHHPAKAFQSYPCQQGALAAQCVACLCREEVK